MSDSKGMHSYDEKLHRQVRRDMKRHKTKKSYRTTEVEEDEDEES